MTDTPLDVDQLLMQFVDRIAEHIASRLAEQDRQQPTVDGLVDEPTMAGRLKVSPQTLQRMRRAENVPFVQMGSRILYHPAQVLDALCNKQEGDQ